jgi:hypothetical protein
MIENSQEAYNSDSKGKKKINQMVRELISAQSNLALEDFGVGITQLDGNISL